MLPTHKTLPFGRSVFFTGLCFLIFGLAAPGRVHAQAASQMYAQGAEAYNRGNVEEAKQKLQTALQIDKNFRPASLLLARIAEDKRKANSPGAASKTLERMIVPVEFSNTTLNEALEFIRQKVAADSGNKVVINFAVNLPPELASKRVTLKMERVPVLEVLRYMGEQAGVKFERQPYAIVVTPAATTATAANAPSEVGPAN